VPTSQLPRLRSTPPPVSVQASPPPGLTSAGHAFVDGVNGFCNTFYEGQKAVDERYPAITVRPQYDAAQQADVRRVDVLLDRLHPPQALAVAYAQFVANEHALYEARVHIATVSRAGGDTSVAGAEFDAAIDQRHQLAHALGARECDGLLPPSQWRAAARAVQRFVLTDVPHQGCVTLVTREYAPAGWPDARRPRSACARALRIQRGETPLLRNIQVSSVTGVESLTATVNFTEVPECGCGQLEVRLYFEHGRWLVRAAIKL
jgi:hypothetical protein